MLDCFIKTIKLEYNVTTKRTSSPSFCEVTSTSFGNLETIEYLSSLKTYKTAQFYYIVEELVNNHGYRRDVTVRGAPYDFRKAPNELEKFQSNLQSLIENMYVENGNSSAILIGHSMGNLQILQLLHKMSQQWKDKFIKAFISISGPYGGAVKAVLTALSGANEKIPFVHALTVREAESSWPSTYYLMPYGDVWSNKSIVATTEGTFTVKELENLMILSGIENAVNHHQDVKRILQKPFAPNVTVYCIYSNDVQTASFLDYRNKLFPDEQPIVTYGAGDGTVNLQSLEICSKWKIQQTKDVFSHTISNVAHLGILKDDRLLKYIAEIILSLN